MNTFTFTFTDGTTWNYTHTCTYLVRSAYEMNRACQQHSSYFNGRPFDEIEKVVYSTKNFDWESEAIRLEWQRLLMLSICAPYYTLTEDGYVEYQLTIGEHYGRDLLCVAFIRYAEERKMQIKEVIQKSAGKGINATALLATPPLLGDGYSYTGHAMLQPFPLFKGSLKMGGLGWAALQATLAEAGEAKPETIARRTMSVGGNTYYSPETYSDAPWEYWTRGDR